MISHFAIIMVVVAVFLGLIALKSKLQERTNPPTEGAVRPKGKDLGRVIIIALAVGVLVWGVLVWGVPRLFEGKPENTGGRVSPGISIVQPKEEWVFSQVNQDGGRHEFGVEVTKHEGGLFYLIIQQNCRGTIVNVAGLRMNETGNKMVGSCVNYIDGDHGTVRLDKVEDNLWSGHYEEWGKRTWTDCWLKKK